MSDSVLLAVLVVVVAGVLSPLPPDRGAPPWRLAIHRWWAVRPRGALAYLAAMAVGIGFGGRLVVNTIVPPVSACSLGPAAGLALAFFTLTSLVVLLPERDREEGL